MPKHYPDPPSMGEYIMTRLKIVEEKLDKLIEMQTARLELSATNTELSLCQCGHALSEHGHSGDFCCSAISCYCTGYVCET